MIEACDRLLARAPGRSDQMVMQHDDAVDVRRRLLEAFFRVVELARADSPGLVAPRAHRIEADDVERG